LKQQAASSYGRFFLPGPTEVHPDVLAAQAKPMIGHRGTAIQELIAGLQPGLREVFVTDRPVLISTSSATGLMEAAILNGVGQGKVLALVNGAFSNRFAEVAAACGREVDVWEVPWGGFHDPAKLADRLGKGYDAVTICHSETSTGVIQDLEAMAEVVAADERALLLVDSVTGIAGAEVRTDAWQLDFVLTGSQKALALPPGLAFAVASEGMMGRAATIPHRGVYFDLISIMRSLESHQTPATPAISLMYALEAQLERILEEGLDIRWKRHAALRDRAIDWVEERAGSGISPFAPAGHRSPTITTVALPETLPGPTVVAGMRERGWVIGGGYGKLKESTVRIGHMGDKTLEDLDLLLEDLGEVIG
jgi:predicted phosphoserine aminotransferase